MPIYWDFHKILLVEPTTDTCAAETLQGKQCTKPLYRPNRMQAQTLLYGMDRQEEVPSTKFAELAEMMLCREMHNSQTRPHLNQIEKVSYKWRLVFGVYAERRKLKRRESIARQRSVVKPVRGNSQTVGHGAVNEIRTPAFKGTNKIEKIAVGQTIVLDTGLQIVGTESDDPFIDDKVSNQRKPNTFGKALRSVSEGTSVEWYEEIPSSTNGVIVGHVEQTASKSSSIEPSFLPPPDAPLETYMQGNSEVSEETPGPMPLENKVPSSSTSTPSGPAKSSNSGAEVSAEENSMKILKSKLPELPVLSVAEVEISASVGGSSQVDTETAPKCRYEFGSGKQVSFLSDSLLSEDLASLPSSFTPDPILVLDPSFWTKASFSTPPKTPADPALAPPSGDEQQAPRSTATLSSVTASVANSTSLPDTQVVPALPASQNQKPLPPFNLGFTTRNPHLSPPAKSSSSTEGNPPAVPFEGFSGFKFGSQYESPPETFDFDTWSKITFKARLRQQSLIWNRLALDHGTTPDNKIVALRVDDSKTAHSASDFPIAVKESTQKALAMEVDPAILSNESIAPKEKSESLSEMPRTPTKHNQPDAKSGLLTPEATPEPATKSLQADKHAGSEGVLHPIEEQRQTTVRVTEEDTNSRPEAKSEPTQDPEHRSKDMFGDALIRSERSYKTHLPIDQAARLLTPPGSPQSSHCLIFDAEASPGINNEESVTLFAIVRKARSSAVITRKPLPSRPVQEEPAEHDPTACKTCRQSPGSDAAKCHCNEFGQIEWENQQASGTTRVLLGRRLRHGAAKKVTEMKRKVTKLADSLVARLEPDTGLKP